MAGKHLKLLDNTTEAAFKAGFKAINIELEPLTVPVAAHTYQRLSVDGVEFATGRQLKRDAQIVFYQMGEDNLVPGVIDVILSIEKNGKEVFVLGVRKRKPAVGCKSNPFSRFQEFGAEIWSQSIERQITYIPLTRPIYHTQSMRWESETMVLKPIKPVRYHPC